MVRNLAPWWRCILRPFCIRATTTVQATRSSSGSSSSSYSCSRYWGFVQKVSVKHSLNQQQGVTWSKYWYMSPVKFHQYCLLKEYKMIQKSWGLPGKFLQPPAELPLTQRPSFTDTVQLFLSSPCSVSGVRLHISNLVKFFLKSSKDILDGNMKDACNELGTRLKHHKFVNNWNFICNRLTALAIIS